MKLLVLSLILELPMAKSEPKFSQPYQDSMVVTVIVAEIASADGWASLDQCLAESAPMVDTYMRFAEAALRAIKRLDKTGIQH